MSEKQKLISRQLKVDTSKTVSQEIERRVDFLVNYALSVPNCLGYVLGISGGQDSTLAGKLAQMAAEKLRLSRPEAKFVAVQLPYAKQFDSDDVLSAIEFIAPDESFVVQIADPVNATVKNVEKATGLTVSDFNKGNIKARTRMIVQYAIAGDNNLLVVGSDHAAEAVTGFYTKFGDGAADIMPLAGLTKRQGAKMLAELQAPKHLWEKIPTADLLDDSPGQSDEEVLGVNYTEIDDYLEGKKVTSKASKNIEQKFKTSQHKREKPVTPTDDWWKNE